MIDPKIPLQSTGLRSVREFPDFVVDLLPHLNALILSEQSKSDISTTSAWGYVPRLVWAAQLQCLLWANIAIALGGSK